MGYLKGTVPTSNPRTNDEYKASIRAAIFTIRRDVRKRYELEKIRDESSKKLLSAKLNKKLATIKSCTPCNILGASRI